MEFHQRLEQLLTERGIKQADLCRMSGISSAQINYLVSGRTKDPKLPTLIAIADALGVTLDCLVGREDAPAPVFYEDAAHEKLNTIYKSLNDEGKKKIVDYACDIADNDRYSAAKSGLQDNKVSNVA